LRDPATRERLAAIWDRPHDVDPRAASVGTFHHEYDAVWPELMEQLEKWVEANDADLEATKDDPLPS
jgi:hypothetical protein